MPRTGHVPRARGGLGAGRLELKGYRDSGPKLTGKPGRWEDLSVPSWGPARTRGQWAWKEGSGQEVGKASGNSGFWIQNKPGTGVGGR